VEYVQARAPTCREWAMSTRGANIFPSAHWEIQARDQRAHVVCRHHPWAYITATA